MVVSVRRQHGAGLLVVGGAPGQAVPLEGGVGLARGGVGHANGLVDDLRTDAVAGDDGDAESWHCINSRCSL
jgi:hypothetical protein